MIDPVIQQRRLIFWGIQIVGWTVVCILFMVKGFNILHTTITEIQLGVIIGLLIVVVGCLSSIKSSIRIYITQSRIKTNEEVNRELNILKRHINNE